ncbi:hypothetical protein ACS0TY_018873 [Phlomoides rotata]
MKILSFNSKGLGNKVKRSEIRGMVSRFRIDMCCIQETKMGKIESKLCRELWCDFNFDWAYKEADGRSGGILTICNNSMFCKTSVWHIKGILVINGYWREDGMKCIIINIYAPCSLREKAELWDTIKLIME